MAELTERFYRHLIPDEAFVGFGANGTSLSKRELLTRLSQLTHLPSVETYHPKKSLISPFNFLLAGVGLGFILFGLNSNPGTSEPKRTGPLDIIRLYCMPAHFPPPFITSNGLKHQDFELKNLDRYDLDKVSVIIRDPKTDRMEVLYADKNRALPPTHFNGSNVFGNGNTIEIREDNLSLKQVREDPGGTLAFATVYNSACN